MFRACLLFVSASLALSAQSASQKADPAFDVVSVKLQASSQPTLVKSRADGRLGWRLRPSGDVCPPITLPAGLPMPPPPPRGPGAQGPPLSIDCVGFSVGGHMFLRRAPMDRFADSLAIFVQRTVVNGTALDGAFDIDLDYAPDPAITQQNAARGPGAPPGPDANTPELFTALEEQLGLKLEATRGPVDALVVDSIARPTDD